MKRSICLFFSFFLLISLCGCGKLNDYNAHTHTFSASIVVPTCSSDGYTLYACTQCGYNIKKNYVSSLQTDGHNYKNFVCTECDDFLLNQATDTETLIYAKQIDENGNETYEVIGDTEKNAYIKIPATHNNIPVTKIANGAFSGSIDLKHIVIPDSIVSIGDMAFENCRRLISVTLPENNYVSIGRETFWDCQKLKIFSFEKITEIDNHSFIGCESLTEIVLSDKITSISPHTFTDCYNIQSITIPLNVTLISHSAFMNNYKLSDIYYAGTMKQWCDIIKEESICSQTEELTTWDAYTGDYTIHCTDGNIIKKRNS